MTGAGRAPITWAARPANEACFTSCWRSRGWRPCTSARRAGAPPTYTQATIPRCRNVLGSGRGLYSLDEPQEGEPILAVLPPEGLLLRTFVDTVEQADDLLKKAARWSARRNQFARP